MSRFSSGEALTVALVGNPNTGKTTLFNRLTGARQRVGNYPGVTVERREGSFAANGRRVRVIDLPGAYSLAPASPDERIVFDLLCGRTVEIGPPDVVVCILDATNLPRNLFLLSQIADTGIPLVAAVNMMDAAELQGIRLDLERLSERLGIPMIATVAARGEGVETLREAIVGATACARRVEWPPAVVDSLESLRRGENGRGSGEAELLRLLFDHGDYAEGTDSERVARARRLLRDAGHDPLRIEAETRYRQIDRWLEGVVVRVPPRRPPRHYWLDRIATHRLLGLVVFAALMFTMFSSIYWLASPLMEGIDLGFRFLGERAGAALESVPLLRSLVVDGMIAGVGGVAVFLPQILILFLFISILEDSGYMARAAFLMDRVFGWTGLNGKSFVPMLSGFACAVPAIMGARTIEDPKARIATVLITPLMSCSARLPVYVLMIGAFLEPRVGPLWAGAALFGMHLLGLVLAIPIAFLINRYLLRFRSLPFLLEMPAYRWPRVRDVALRMYRSGREFVLRAGTVIFAFSIVIWGLTYFPRSAETRARVRREVEAERRIPPSRAEALLETDLAPRLDSAYIEESYLGRFGKFVQPVFAPAGYDWRLTVAVLASFPAREVVVSTLGIIYNLEADEKEKGEASATLRERMLSSRRPDGRPVFTVAVALSVMVFFALCLQCGSTVAVIGREIGWRWAAFAFGYMTALAWAGAVLVYQAGSRIGA